MQLQSTKDKNNVVDLKTAVLDSYPIDKGLYMPTHIPKVEDAFLRGLQDLSFQDICLYLAHKWIGDDIPYQNLEDIITKAIDFQAPVKSLDNVRYSLELWHGPSLAFKDFGARFMAGLMSYFLSNEQKKLTILVATSGDTGGAVASGFFKTPDIEVIILYPSGKVSPLQEKQLTTLGHNIHAIEVEGTFDDCQALVKKAFLDDDLRQKHFLGSANSINIARLIPQSFYYFEAFKQVIESKKDIVFSVPSGNFGNLTAGVLSKKMGLPIKRFIAATNSNNVVPSYLDTGIFTPKTSIQTISNAMDVGAPSNFDRLTRLYGDDWHVIKSDIQGYWCTDEETKRHIVDAYHKHNYLCDPHGAIAYGALKTLNKNEIGIFLETAHPSKFLETMRDSLGFEPPIPSSLSDLMDKSSIKQVMAPDFEMFKTYLLDRPS